MYNSLTICRIILGVATSMFPRYSFTRSARWLVFRLDMGPRAVDIFFRLACIIYAGLRHGQTAGLTRTSSPSTVTKMTITKVDDLFDGITTHCGSAQFYGYHDPNVHVLLIFVFGIFALVFIYYVSRRRPRCEYGLMILWCVSAYQLLSCANKKQCKSLHSYCASTRTLIMRSSA